MLKYQSGLGLCACVCFTVNRYCVVPWSDDYPMTRMVYLAGQGHYGCYVLLCGLSALHCLYSYVVKSCVCFSSLQASNPYCVCVFVRMHAFSCAYTCEDTFL